MAAILPATSDDLTPWLLNQLLADAPEFAGAEIVSTDVEIIGTGRGFVGEVARVSLTFAGNHPSAPDSIVAKLPARHDSTREFGFSGGAYEHEYLFYTHLAGDCGLPVPDCYFAGFDGRTQKTVLLIEDLSDYHSPGPGEEISIEDATMVVRSHAAMHAKWWGGGGLAPFPWLDRSGADRRETFRSSVQKGLAKVPDFDPRLWPDGVLDILNKMDNILDLMWDREDRGPRTLVQFDSRPGNVLFSRSTDQADRLKFIDFGGIALGNGAADIAYFATWGVSPDARRAREPGLMRLYYDCLMERGVQDYEWDQFSEDYRWGQFRFPIVILLALGALDTSTIDNEIFTRAFSSMVALIDWDCAALLK